MIGTKPYKVGMYGGKFLPFHLGHKFCLDTAVRECELVYLLLFINGEGEDKARANDPWCPGSEREHVIREFATRHYDSVIFKVIDTSQLRNPDGSEDWDGETPLVLEALGGEPDAVYGSEPEYGDYFSRAYPNAVYRCLDPERSKVPISATEIRRNYKENQKWIVKI